jgi:hypothetical protein
LEYLMDNATPQPAEFKINKFGHLEVRLLGADEVHSFAKAATVASESGTARRPLPVPSPLPSRFVARGA